MKDTPLKQTSLHDLHIDHNAKMVAFAGYNMPIQYADGVMQEHEWVRQHAGLFDVSHMGQIVITGEGAADFISRITPSVFYKTPDNRAKYTVLTNEDGGIIDDLIITRIHENEFFAVINAGCKEKDIAWIQKNLPDNLTLTRLDDRSLIALQGPEAQNAIEKLLESNNIDHQPYMSLDKVFYQGAELFISRLGYTGEDGFEISVPDAQAVTLWNALLAYDNVKEIGLGARDTLRLEMGYPLYGHDIDDSTSPVEADLGWVIAKTNDTFIGADKILRDKANGVAKKRVGIQLVERGVAREGAVILNSQEDEIGVLTSGGFSPSLKTSIGQGYIASEFANIDEDIYINVRGRHIKAKVAKLPFITPKTKSIK